MTLTLSKSAEKKIKTEVGSLPNISFIKDPALALVKQTQHVKASLQPAYLIDVFKADSLEEAAIDCVKFLNPSFYESNRKVVDEAKKNYRDWCKKLHEVHLKNKEEAEASRPKVASRPVSEKHAEEVDYMIDGIIKGRVKKITPMLINHVVKADKEFLKLALESNKADKSEVEDKEYWERRKLVSELLESILAANGKQVLKKKKKDAAEPVKEEAKSKPKRVKSDNVKIGIAPTVLKTNQSVYDSWSIIEETGGHLIIMPPITVNSEKAARFTPSSEFYFISASKVKQYIKRTNGDLTKLGTVKRILNALKSANILHKTDAPKAITASEPGKFTVVSFIKPE